MHKDLHEATAEGTPSAGETKSSAAAIGAFCICTARSRQEYHEMVHEEWKERESHMG
jgi:hypothetical protein